VKFAPHSIVHILRCWTCINFVGSIMLMALMTYMDARAERHARLSGEGALAQRAVDGPDAPRAGSLGVVGSWCLVSHGCRAGLWRITALKLASQLSAWESRSATGFSSLFSGCGQPRYSPRVSRSPIQAHRKSAATGRAETGPNKQIRSDSGQQTSPPLGGVLADCKRARL